MNKKFLIIHIDGVSFFKLQQAISSGQVPFLAHLLKKDYKLSQYHSGLPSTTPYAQAGLLYGNNDNIPSFRWFDRDKKIVVNFGLNSNFDQVSTKYFKSCRPLLKGGAAIGACFDGGASQTFGVLYHNPRVSQSYKRRDKLQCWLYILDPRHTIAWLLHGVYHLLRLNWENLKSQIKSRPVSPKYVFSDLFQEIFWHKISEFAVRQAIRAQLPMIFVGFYAFDELGHAFGPHSKFATETLTEIDHSISEVVTFAQQQNEPYEVLIYSDHGQNLTMPYTLKFNTAFGQLLSDLLPRYQILEHQGFSFGPSSQKSKKIVITYSGGLAHLYFADKPMRLTEKQLNTINPKLLPRLSLLPGVAFILVKDTGQDVIYIQGTRQKLSALTESQLSSLVVNTPNLKEAISDLTRLNSFSASGDVIIFSAYDGKTQINFEQQVGGHACLDREQSTPFFIFNKSFRTVRSLTELHDQLVT